MQDRVSLYPGRVKLVPVAGQENTYDMVRADSPTQEGTPLNKDSLLKDATAALYGLDETAVPDDALAMLKPIVDDTKTAVDKCGNCKIVYGTYTGNGNYGEGNASSLSFSKKPLFVFIRPSKRVSSDDYSLSLLQGTDAAFSYPGVSNSCNQVTWSGNRVEWYAYGRAAEYQLNVLNATYCYIALIAADT